MKLLILTADSSLLKWKTLNSKLGLIKKALNQTKNATWEIEIRYQDLKPTLNSNHRIAQWWYDQLSHQLFRNGNHFIYLHFSSNQWLKFGFPKGLRGADQIDVDFVGESYGWSDEHTKRGKKRNSQFIQNVLHELSHAIARSTGAVDKTHEYHAKNADISGIFSTYDMTMWHPKYQAGVKEINRLQVIVDSLLGRHKLQHFFPLHQTAITQAYGVKNFVWYPKTGHHIGTDYGTPVGTPIIAPTDCTVTRAKTDIHLGNWCEVKVNDIYLVFAHLKSAPILGTRKSGQVIGFTGNTGQSTGPHCHVEGHYQPRDISQITKDNFRKMTFDVTSLFK